MQPMEQLESRRLLANFSASSVAELIADINAANAAGGSNTITLKAATAFTLNATDNNSAGPTGLPRIETGNDLTIFGSGDTIQRNTARGTPAFRLFTVLQGGSLTLNDLTLSNGRMNTGFSFDGAQGGGIYSEGALNLNHVTVQNCIAEGAIGGGFASGGGIASYSVLNVVDSRFKNNQALGGDGAWGGLAKGGALYVYNTATVTSTTFSSNLA